MIPYGRQTIEEDDIQAVVDVLKSDYLTTGPKIAEFEKAVADYVGAKYAVAISNDTAALHAACHAAGIGEGDEVITTPITFAASSNCVLYCGGTPVFADIDPKTYNIDPEDIKRKITEAQGLTPPSNNSALRPLPSARTSAGFLLRNLPRAPTFPLRACTVFAKSSASRASRISRSSLFA